MEGATWNLINFSDAKFSRHWSSCLFPTGHCKHRSLQILAIYYYLLMRHAQQTVWWCWIFNRTQLQQLRWFYVLERHAINFRLCIWHTPKKIKRRWEAETNRRNVTELRWGTQNVDEMKLYNGREKKTRAKKELTDTQNKRDCKNVFILCRIYLRIQF
jgi:hypothetical protein